MHYVGDSYSFAVVSRCEYIASYLFLDNTWDVLRDNYMMGSTMKDWDRNCDSDSVTEQNSDTDSGSDT